MAATTLELRPFTSLLLGRRPTQRDPTGFVNQVLADLTDLLESSSPTTRTYADIGVPEQHRQLWVGWLSYIEQRAPTWAPSSDLRDETNHLAVVALRGKFVGIYTSDPWMARKIAKLGDDKRLAVGSLCPIPVGTINHAFAHGPARTLWLAGIHRRTESKADSKVLSGLDLSFALDPLGDQSYYFTAARVSVDLPNLPAARQRRAVGFNPRKSRVWAGPARDWDEFTRLVYSILGRVKNADGEEADLEPIPILASPVTGPSDLADAYDMSVIAPELLSDTAVLDPVDEEVASRWAYDARFDVRPKNDRDFDADVYLHEKLIGTLEFGLAIATDGSTGVTIGCSDPDDHLLTQARDVCMEPSYLTVRYESGHTLANGVVYSTHFRDMPFENWGWWPMPGIDITKEKPPKSRNFDPKRIGKDDSLFCWVKRNWPPPTGATPGWLACDDGAGEIADFIHVDTANRQVTLIHVKASHSASPDRQISTSDYEVVVGQAVKNLRQLDRVNLADRLWQGNHKAVAWATWHNGRKQKDRTRLVAAVQKLGEDYKRRVVVLQPRITASEYQWARDEWAKNLDTSRVKRLQQLDALLVEAESACRDLGAVFEVMGQQV